MSRKLVRHKIDDKKSPTFRLSFSSTHDDSVLELFYKDLVQLYDLKDVLKHEGLSDYATNHHISQDSQRNSTLQLGS